MQTHALSCFRWGFARTFLLFAVLVGAGIPSAAKANLISLQGSGELLPNTAGQQITLLMSGSDFYTDSNLHFKINGGVGPAPRVTHVFGDTGGAISPVSLFAGSLWQNGGIAVPPQGTYPGSSGLDMMVPLWTSAFTPQNTSGVYAVLTVTTVGVPVGSYSMDLTTTDLFNGLTEEFDPIPVPLELAAITLTVVPEPSSYLLALLGVAAVFTVRARRSAHSVATRFRWAFARTLLISAALVGAGTLPAAKANLISLQGSGELLPNTAGQQITLLMSGSDYYTDSNLWFKINGGIGPAPRVTHVFGDTGAAVEPSSLLDGTIWQGGASGIGNDALGTYPGASGLDMLVLFGTPGFTPQNTSGVYAVLTVTTVGVPAGSYAFDLTGTDLYNGLIGGIEPIPVPLELGDITLTVVPEPSSYLLALLGVAAVLTVRVRCNARHAAV
jgi:hypothetical protein